MKRKFFANKKAMSIVISTVIIIAISITMSIAVAFWAMGIGNSFTKFEKLEFVSIYADTTQLQATAQATIFNGRVTGVSMIINGAGYINAPAVIFSGGGGNNAAAAAVVVNGQVNRITVTNPGSGYSSAPTVTIAPPTSNNFPVYIQLKNSGSAAATINNVFIDDKPFNVVGAQTNLVPANTAQNVVLQVGQRRNDFYIMLPMGSTWNSGDYVEITIQTTGGRQYANTVLLP